jgi:hypothetical protein
VRVCPFILGWELVTGKDLARPGFVFRLRRFFWSGSSA